MQIRHRCFYPREAHACAHYVRLLLTMPKINEYCFIALDVNLSQNAKRASARKDTGLDQSLFSVQLFRLRINIIKVCIRDQIRAI